MLGFGVGFDFVNGSGYTLLYSGVIRKDYKGNMSGSLMVQIQV